MGCYGCNRGNDCFKKSPYTIRIRCRFISTEYCNIYGYAKSLTAASKERYKEKISLIGGLDPFLKDKTALSLPERLEQS